MNLLVIFTAANNQGILSVDDTAFLLVVVSLSMVTAPLLLKLQDWWFERNLNTDDESELESDVYDKRPRVIIAGFGRFRRLLDA